MNDEDMETRLATVLGARINTARLVLQSGGKFSTKYIQRTLRSGKRVNSPLLVLLDADGNEVRGVGTRTLSRFIDCGLLVDEVINGVKTWKLADGVTPQQWIDTATGVARG